MVYTKKDLIQATMLFLKGNTDFDQEELIEEATQHVDNILSFVE